jgi:hypothetical protein
MKINMIKKILVLFYLLLSFSFIFSEATGDIIEKISKKEIKIGEKINLSLKIPKMKDVKVLWQDMSYSDTSADIISKKDFYKDDYLNLEIVFTFFSAGNYNKFFFTVPISKKDGEMVYLESDKFDINVKSPLTKEELENVKNLNDPSKIELRKEKEQAKFSFRFEPYVIIILIVLGVILIGLILYFVLYKQFMKKKNVKVQKKKLPPYEEFLASAAKVDFDMKEERIVIENKLSFLTEILKELIYNEYSLNAPSETTRELINSLQEINFDSEITVQINKLFQEIDMIKFAKSEYDYDKLVYFLSSIKNLGSNINNIYKAKIELEEKKDAHI